MQLYSPYQGNQIICQRTHSMFKPSGELPVHVLESYLERKVRREKYKDEPETLKVKVPVAPEKPEAIYSEQAERAPPSTKPTAQAPPVKAQAQEAAAPAGSDVIPITEPIMADQVIIIRDVGQLPLYKPVRYIERPGEEEKVTLVPIQPEVAIERPVMEELYPPKYIPELEQESYEVVEKDVPKQPKEKPLPLSMQEAREELSKAKKKARSKSIDEKRPSEPSIHSVPLTKEYAKNPFKASFESAPGQAYTSKPPQHPQVQTGRLLIRRWVGCQMCVSFAINLIVVL
eukprot:TRINITY_DN176_c0_g1_i9.p1 TRINITY_DN176_c0_g1~~TRINITY_DN176_c0_g1_i9.p1  ORF type:complete len:287 (+),score=18.07 TRINITY_DN176_c0_g1_i9:278-1138(+)